MPSRREFLQHSSLISMGSLGIVPFDVFSDKGVTPDHFLVGCDFLENGIQFIKDKTGIEAVRGGKHPGVGTHNALISLGKNVYLEIIAPDPDAPALVSRYAFLRDLSSPQLFYWAAGTHDIEKLEADYKKAGYTTGGVSPGSRRRTDGILLQWKTLFIETEFSDLVPFFIQWDSNSLHPSTDAPAGCTVEHFEIQTAQKEKVQKIFKGLQLNVPVEAGEKNRLVLILQTPKGKIYL